MKRNRLIHRLRLSNLLSFGPDAEEVELRPLNVLIGPNGSGKSNLIEAISLFKAAPQDLVEPIREGGGIGAWIWKGEAASQTAQIEAIIENPNGNQALRYALTFAQAGQRFELSDERIENEQAYPDQENPYFYFGYRNGQPYLNQKGIGQRQLLREDVNPEQSILSQRRDPDSYPEITYLGDALRKIRLYREWSFGRSTPPRLPQPADLPNDFLAEDGRNLGLVLNLLRTKPGVKKKLLEALRELNEGIDDFDTLIQGGTVQLFMQEGNISIPATRLSDGTLRYLCLLAIVCHPNPPPLVCIEEPELGLHPDILPPLAKLLLEASERCQLIVTTHSEVLVDALTDSPESILVCEKPKDRTEMRRLERKDLAAWLERYRLGELWRSGELGGNRW